MFMKVRNLVLSLNLSLAFSPLLNPLYQCCSLSIWNKFHLGHALCIRCKLIVKFYPVCGLANVRICSMEPGVV